MSLSGSDQEDNAAESHDKQGQYIYQLYESIHQCRYDHYCPILDQDNFRDFEEFCRRRLNHNGFNKTSTTKGKRQMMSESVDNSEF